MKYKLMVAFSWLVVAVPAVMAVLHFTLHLIPR